MSLSRTARPWPPSGALEPSGFAFITPSPSLRPYVRGLLDIRLAEAAGFGHPRLRQPPEPALGLFFHYGEPVRVVMAEGEELHLRSHVTGVHEVAHALTATGACGAVTVGLTPLGAACFQGGAPARFTHRRVPMEEVVPGGWVRELEGRLAAQPDREARIAVAEAALRQLFIPHEREDFVAWAAQQIWDRGGRVRVADLALRGGLGERQAERLFTAEYGIGIKRFGRIVRLRTAMDLVRARTLPLVEIAAATGFSDQAHLVREFKAMLATTPQALQRISLKGGVLRHSFKPPKA